MSADGGLGTVMGTARTAALVEEILRARHAGDESTTTRAAVGLVVRGYAHSASRRADGIRFAEESAAFYDREARSTQDGDGDVLRERARAERRIARAIEGLAS